MKRAYDLFISLRYLRAKNKQAFFSIITFISLGGITLGVASLIIVLAVMNGFQKDIRENILSIKSHIVIYDKTYRAIPDYQRTVDIAKATKGVVSATPFVFSQGMMKIGSTTEGAALWGVDPLQQPKVCDTETKILLPAQDKKPGIILGKELAARIYARVGDEVVIITPIFKTTALGMIPKFAKYEVVGIFKSGMYEYDATFAYIYLHDAQQLFEIPGRISGIDIRVKDIYSVKEIDKDLRGNIDSNLGVYDWMVMNKNLFSALKLEKIVMGIILTLIILVAAFNVLSSLIMMVMRKRKDIGILRTLGVSQRGIMKIFIYQGMVVGMVGTFMGAVIGITLSMLLQKYHLIPLSGEVYYIDHVPAELKIFDIGLIVGVSLLLSFISTLYPARQAAKMDPVDAVRYE
ncbi:MAG: hypothetical protein A2452_00290 [Candidatus Firestonebacteria bacterium RIFOXYC2_FULL_39_67]|nr:MAG: hypothetical protein A2536_03370 [Candidatus Firestonebacteria bacterium RIFOXYD2_FULL_39_29]OGF53744.1 MAG: hypothetical protein A2497_02800 [Candidatus Firestonebacteria bacterium RifOxyC12_full_39_7]OGF54972.1 MAG: hypothetical protein A2452_00290 [Candidatus Firestonebacteria bacterium RIFOXYC2_FULL_39_67]